MRYNKKIWAMALALIMLLGLVPSVSYANDLGGDWTGTWSSEGMTETTSPSDVTNVYYAVQKGEFVYITYYIRSDAPGVYGSMKCRLNPDGSMSGKNWFWTNTGSPDRYVTITRTGDIMQIKRKTVNGEDRETLYAKKISQTYPEVMLFHGNDDEIIDNQENNNNSNEPKTINEIMTSGKWQQKGNDRYIYEFYVMGTQVKAKYYMPDGKYRGEYEGNIIANGCSGYWKRKEGKIEGTGPQNFIYENGVFLVAAFNSGGNPLYETELVPYDGSVGGGSEPAPTGQNMLKNPSFEEGLQYWVNPAGDWISSPNTDGPGIYYAVHEKNLAWAQKSNAKDTCIYQDVPLNGLPVGQELKLRVQTSNWPQQPKDRSRIKLNYLDASGNSLQFHMAEGTHDSWYKLEISGPIPAGAVTARVELWAIYYNGVIVDAYYDDIVLTGGSISNNNNNNNNTNNTNNTTPAPDKAVPVSVTGGREMGTTSVFNGVTGVSVSFKKRGGQNYTLFRSTNPDELGTSVTDSHINSDHFTDVNVEPSTTYYYTLKEADSFNNGAPDDKLATWTVTTAASIGQNFGDSTKTRHSIMLKIDEPTMSVDGRAREVDPGRGTKPIVVKGRTMVPIRAIVEAMGGSVGWKSSSKEVSLVVNGIDVKMWVDKKELSKNNSKSRIDVAPSVIKGRTYVPLRFAAENLNCQVDWINSTKSIVIVWTE